LGEHALALDDVDDEGPLPELTAVVVAVADEVEDLLVARRAHLARGCLQLRDLERAFAVRVDDDGAEAELIDIEGAKAFLRTSLDHQLRQRRAELDAEVDAARLTAARLVADAHEEAVGILAAANEAIVGTLLEGLTSHVGAEVTPTLRVVGSELDRAQERARDAHPTAPAQPPAPAPALAPAPAPASATAPVPVAVSAAPKWGVRSFLYVDVLLPLVAVVLVLLVLLAWVG
jgi:hypothetical protein